MSQHLFLFQIGPVQSFIAQARRTQDLYIGSRILSMLASAGIEEALRNGVELRFPALLDNGDLPESVPHRFAFLSKTDEPARIGENIEAWLQHYWWENYGVKVGSWLHKLAGDGEWTERFETQVRNWLEIYWSAVPTESHKTYGEAYQAVSAVLAARKSARHFPQVDDTRETKCTMTGAIAALPLNWQALSRRLGERKLRENERLGALAMIKRFAGDAGCDLGRGVDVERSPFRSTTLIAGNADDRENDEDTSDLNYPWLAVLHMDGDQMGKLLGTQKGDNAHGLLSQKLSRFSQAVARLIPHPGELVYAGGDDVLALLPLSTVLQTANQIRLKFKEIVGDEATISAGIAIMGVKTPLESALESARLAEHMAKHDLGRNAVVVRDMRSNAIRETGAKWDAGIHISELVETLQLCFNAGQISTKLGYDVLEISHDMGGSVPAAARKAELGRLIRRRTEQGKSLPEEHIAWLIDQIVILAERDSWQRVAHWIILARFLAKGGERGL